MSARDSKNTAATAPAKGSTEPKGILARLAPLLRLDPHVKQFFLWMGIAFVGTFALGAITNVLTSEKKNSEPQGFVPSESQTPSGGGFYGSWWNPSSAEGQVTSEGHRSFSNGAEVSSSAGSISVIPSNTGIPISTGSLNATNLVPISSNPLQQAYNILGLRTGSTPALGGTLTVNSSPTIANRTNSAALVSFSLSGSMALVPVNNLEPGGVSAGVAFVPEPTTVAMLATGLAGLALSRRRKAPPLA